MGGFELAGLRPVLVRAFNVLRQYPVEDVAGAWAAMRGGITYDGLIVDGTCDELGRLSLALACDPGRIEQPSDLAACCGGPASPSFHNGAGCATRSSPCRGRPSHPPVLPVLAPLRSRP